MDGSEGWAETHGCDDTVTVKAIGLAYWGNAEKTRDVIRPFSDDPRRARGISLAFVCERVCVAEWPLAEAPQRVFPDPR